MSAREIWRSTKPFQSMWAIARRLVMLCAITICVSASRSVDWAAGSAERPNIRPPVPSPLSAGGPPQTRRGSGNTPNLPSDDLGIEESEYDTPAYLRRARTGGAADYGMSGYRMPSDK